MAASVPPGVPRSADRIGAERSVAQATVRGPCSVLAVTHRRVAPACQSATLLLQLGKSSIYYMCVPVWS